MIAGVSFDTPAENKDIREKFDFPFALFSDTSKQMAIAYGAAADESAVTPGRAACVINADGKVHKWWAKVDAREFPAAVLQELPPATR